MPNIARFQLPDGRVGRFEVPDGISPEEAQKLVEEHINSKPELSLGTAAAQGLWNLPMSAAKFAVGVADSALHPIDTTRTLLNAAQGGIQSALPDFVNAGLEKYAPGYDLENKQVAGAIANDYKKAYGGWKNIKQTLADDPVRMLSDASLASSIVGAGAKAAGLGKVARIANTVSDATNPVNLAGKAVVNGGKLGSILIGNIGTHTGAESLSQAFKAGAEGGNKLTGLVDNMRGAVDQADIVPKLRANLAQMRAEDYQRYLSGMNGIKADPAILDFTKIEDAVKSALDVSTYKGRTGVSGVAINTNKAADSVKAQIVSLVDEFKNAPPNEFHTPGGFDELKRGIGNIMGNYDHGTPQFTVAKRVYDAAKNEIINQAPVYAEVMKNSQKGIELTDEIERSLKLGHKGSADTALRALQSVMRNNANSNFGSRMKNVQRIDPNGDIMAELAGQALSANTPRGLGSIMAGGTLAGAAYLHNPLLAGSLVFQSPRLMGETAVKLGQASRYAKPALQNKLTRSLARAYPLLQAGDQNER